MRFGVFMAPYHEPGENPTLALERDLELIVRLDELGFDEAWVGEHHSTGWETIASPEIFLAVAAERTRHIRLGTGVVSLPYHHPLMVADRIVLLDHLTRGRVNFGVGPGGHLTDARMLGIDPDRLRPMMAEALDVVVRLLSDPEPLTVEGSWFTLRDAVLQLRPHQRPHPPIAVTSMESPAGMVLAGRHGAGVLSLTVARGPRGPIDLAAHWRLAEESAQENGRTVRREDWRLVVPDAPGRDPPGGARRRPRPGRRASCSTTSRASPAGRAPCRGRPSAIIDQMVEAGSWVVGTPDDAVAAIERLQERSGGFGCLAVTATEWAPREKVLRSYELLARHVMPRFQGSLEGIDASNAVARASAARTGTERTAAVEAAQRDYEERGSRGSLR